MKRFRKDGQSKYLRNTTNFRKANKHFMDRSRIPKRIPAVAKNEVLNYKNLRLLIMVILATVSIKAFGFIAAFIIVFMFSFFTMKNNY